MNDPYCSLCDEHLAPEQTICPFCEEEAVEYSDHCERVWEGQQEDAYDRPTLDEQHQLAWKQKQELRR